MVLFEIGKGRYFSPYEYSSGSNVAVLGAEVAERLFEKADPVGKEVRMSGYKARVIGVLKKEGQGGIKFKQRRSAHSYSFELWQEFYKFP